MRNIIENSKSGRPVWDVKFPTQIELEEMRIEDEKKKEALEQAALLKKEASEQALLLKKKK